MTIFEHKTRGEQIFQKKKLEVASKLFVPEVWHEAISILKIHKYQAPLYKIRHSDMAPGICAPCKRPLYVRRESIISKICDVVERKGSYVFKDFVKCKDYVTLVVH
jgi:hypothetical protein